MKKHITTFNIKSVENTGSFEGYASVFATTDAHQDIVLPGAFKDSIRTRLQLGEIKLLWQHKPEEPIGIIDALEEDSHGLHIKGRLLLELQKGREAYALLKSGAIDGLSIGYAIRDADYDAKGIRILKDLELFEISLVTYPANGMARVKLVKNMLPNTEREFEAFLRDAGFSNKTARSITCHGFKDAQERDVLHAPISVEDMIAFDGTLNKAMHALNQLIKG